MKILTTVAFTSIVFLSFGCGGGDTGEGGVNASESIATEPDYEDSDTDNSGGVDYEESSASSSITARTTNYSDRADSLQTMGDTLVEPTYTDDEYEAAFSTSTTNPKNQVEGGLRPKKKKD